MAYRYSTSKPEKEEGENRSNLYHENGFT